MSDQRGFTLVEVLAALVVGGLLLAALSALLSNLSKDLHADERRDELAQVETIAPILKTLLESAIPQADDAESQLTLRHMALTVAPPQAFAGAGPLRLDLDVERTATGDALVASLTPADKTDQPPAVANRHLLAQGFKHIAFESSEPDETDAPSPLKIMFQPQKGDPLNIVAEPRLSSDASCHFDPISMSCRP